MSQEEKEVVKDPTKAGTITFEEDLSDLKKLLKIQPKKKSIFDRFKIKKLFNISNNRKFSRHPKWQEYFTFISNRLNKKDRFLFWVFLNTNLIFLQKSLSKYFYNKKRIRSIDSLQEDYVNKIHDGIRGLIKEYQYEEVLIGTPFGVASRPAATFIPPPHFKKYLENIDKDAESYSRSYASCDPHFARLLSKVMIYGEVFVTGIDTTKISELDRITGRY